MQNIIFKMFIFICEREAVQLTEVESELRLHRVVFFFSDSAEAGSLTDVFLINLFVVVYCKDVKLEPFIGSCSAVCVF